MSGMRSTIQSVGLWMIVALISGVFILQFGGPQAQGCSPNDANAYAAEVYGQKISVGEFKAAYLLANGPNYRDGAAQELQLKERILGGLIERNLLAREAREVGFAVEEEEVMERLAADGLIYTSAAVGSPRSIPRGPQPINLTDKEGNFDAENARRFIQNRLGRSVEEFGLSQIEETLAQRMREVYVSSVVVSPEEVWDTFVRERERATVRYARFDAAFYADQLTIEDGEVAAWAAKNDDAVQAEYERQKHRYTGLEKQVRARHILIKADQAADEPTKAAARTKAEQLRKRAAAGEDFAKLSGEFSEDTVSAKQGGDLGFNTRGRMVAPFDEAQFSLAAGELSEVVETQFGFHVIKVEGVREGDVPVAEAKLELAERLFKDAKAEELAHESAKQAQAALAAGSTMDELDTQLVAQAEASDKKALAPGVKETRSFGRTDSPIPGLDADKLVEAAFELTIEAPLAKAPMQLGKSWIVYRLEAREKAVKEDFEGGEKTRLQQALKSRKQSEALDHYVLQLRKRAEGAGEVLINQTILVYPTSAGQS